MDFVLVRVLVELKEDIRHHERCHLEAVAILEVNVREGSQLLQIVDGRQLLKEGDPLRDGEPRE